MDAIRTTSAFRESFRKFRRKRLLAKFAIRRATQTPLMPGKLIDILIISPGGVATTTLLEYLARHVRTNCRDDTDGLKHLPFPPHWLEETGQKVLFISGDTESIRRSIEHRGWLHLQGAKLGSVAAAVLPLRLARVFFKFAVRRQIYRWRAWCAHRQHQGLFIQFAEIWSSVERIAAFCGIKEHGFVSSFPKQRVRGQTTGSDLIS